MKISQIARLVEGQVLCGESKLDEEVEYACGSDLMSDALSYVKAGMVLLTGLVTPHVIRTAEMIDLPVIVFVRAKMPTQEIIDMAKEHDIVIIRTRMTLFDACGVLYVNGLLGKGCI